MYDDEGLRKIQCLREDAGLRQGVTQDASGKQTDIDIRDSQKVERT